MHAQEKQEIANQIIYVAQNTSHPSQSKEAEWHSKILGLDNGSSIILIDKVADMYDDIGKRLLNKWSDKFSEAYVFNAVHKLVGRAVKGIEEDNIQKILEYLVAQLEVLADEFKNFSQEQTVYIPLSGVLMKINSQTFGNVTLVNMNDSQLIHLINESDAVVRHSELSQEEKEKAINNRRQELNKHLANRVCAIYSVVAEPRKAKELALEECRNVLNLLRYASHQLYKRSAKGYKIAVGLWGEVVRYGRDTIILPSNAPEFTTFSELI